MTALAHQLPEERKVDLLKNLAESSPYTAPQDSRLILPAVVQILKASSWTIFYTWIVMNIWWMCSVYMDIKILNIGIVFFYVCPKFVFQLIWIYDGQKYSSRATYWLLGTCLTYALSISSLILFIFSIHMMTLESWIQLHDFGWEYPLLQLYTLLNLLYVLSDNHASKKSRGRDELYLCWVLVIRIPPSGAQG